MVLRVAGNGGQPPARSALGWESEFPCAASGDSASPVRCPSRPRTGGLCRALRLRLLPPFLLVTLTWTDEEETEMETGACPQSWIS